MTRPNRHEAECRKHNALANLEAYRESIILAARRAFLHLLIQRGTANADDVRGEVELPPGIDPRCFGAVPGPLARLKIIRAAGYVFSARPEGHSRPVRVWVLADREAAIRWLTGHPDRPAPERQRSLFDDAAGVAD